MDDSASSSGFALVAGGPGCSSTGAAKLQEVLIALTILDKPACHGVVWPHEGLSFD